MISRNPQKTMRDQGFHLASLLLATRCFLSSDGQNTDKSPFSGFKSFHPVTTLSSIGKE